MHISEMWFNALHPEEQEEKYEVKIKYDVTFLIDLALSTGDEEWFYQLTSLK